MNQSTETANTEPQADEAQPLRPVPSIWTIVWPLLGSLSGFTAAYFAFNGSSNAIWFGLLAGACMLLGQLSKPKAAS